MHKRIIWCVAVLSITAGAAIANAAGGVGETMFSVGFSQGGGEFAWPVSTGPSDYVLTTFLPSPAPRWPEIGMNAEIDHTFAEDYALAVSFDWRVGSNKFEKTTFAAPTDPVIKLTSSAWKVRVGGDRLGKIGDRFKWFFGPGIEYGSGKAKYENLFSTVAPDNNIEGEPTNKYGLNGRFGGVMMLTPTVGIKGQIGNSFGIASVKDSGGKTTWWYSDFESAWGLQFAFGGQ